MDRLTGQYKTTGIYDKILNLDTILINDIPINISKCNNTLNNKVVYENLKNYFHT